MIAKDTIEFLNGQKGNKGITLMEKFKYDEVIDFIEQRERYFNVLKNILEILFNEQ